MPTDHPTPQIERIEQHALERDLVAQLSPSKEKQAKAKARAERLRKLLDRVKARDANA